MTTPSSLPTDTPAGDAAEPARRSRPAKNRSRLRRGAIAFGATGILALLSLTAKSTWSPTVAAQAASKLNASLNHGFGHPLARVSHR